VLFAFGLTDKGRVRPTNEDCFAIREELGLCLVADGMGGHNAGEVAARLAVDAVIDFVAAGDRSWPFGYEPSWSLGGNLLRTAIQSASMRIFEIATASDTCAGMGTTIVAARVVDRRLTVAHVGDSRLYLMSGGTLTQLTQDDSWMAAMLAGDPDLDPQLLMHHPMRGALTNVVGAGARTDVHVTEITLVGGETLLLSTDGVHGVMDDARLQRLLSEDEDPQAIATAVVASALTRGSRDNCTAVVARCS
jgi:protein phosphatase